MRTKKNVRRRTSSTNRHDLGFTTIYQNRVSNLCNSAMAAKHYSQLLFFIVAVVFLQFRLSLTGQVKSLESVPDLEKSMYSSIDGYPCVRLLNLSGEIGCSNPGQEMVVAPIVRYRNVDKLDDPSAILVSQDEVHTFFSRVLHDQHFSKKVSGAIIESNEIQNKERGFSPVEKFPQASFAPYMNHSYEWNPTGSSILWNKYNFPVFLISQDSKLILEESALQNEKSNKAYDVDVAQFDLVMQTTKAGTHDSESCLRQQSCLPLGGYSVLSSLPPIDISSARQSMPILLAVTSMDSASLFRDKSPGADSPLSGLISLLAAVDALSHIDGIHELTKQLVFLVFTGESWGYLGSRRFLAELELQTNVVDGINSSLIELVLEVGSVGRGLGQGVDSFFAHTAGDSPAAKKTLDALQYAQKSLGESFKISMASSSNPGIPPSSLMTFLKKDPSIVGVVLEDFDTTFNNNFYHSHLDDLSNINSSAIVAAASLVARSLYILASDNKQLSTTALNSINVNSSLVEELVGCLLTCEPGLSCELVKDYIVPKSTCPDPYVGVYLMASTSTPYNEYVSDISRFTWNFLAERTSTPRDNVSSVCKQDCSNKGEVCIRAENEGKGRCVNSTTRYVPAYSTRLKFESGAWNVILPNASDPLGIVDPVWTESFWNTISLRVYTAQSATYDQFILLGGIAITVLAYLAILVTRTVITKALKHD